MRKTILRALGFVLGFTTVFVSMGALAGTLGSFLTQYQTIVNLISGIIVILFGLNFIGILKVNVFRGRRKSVDLADSGLGTTIVFGVVFSLGWTPCVGAFLGSALMLASQQGQMLTGILMLLCYSVGLGIPFVLSAVLIDSLKGTFDFIKRNYRIINIMSGSLLVVVGVLMATGRIGVILG